MCVPSAANELRVSRVQVWECLESTGEPQSLLVRRNLGALTFDSGLVEERGQTGSHLEI